MQQPPPSGRADRPVVETRWVCAFVSTVLVLAVAMLWIQPDRTDELFAWTIKPDITPLYMGSAYAAGALFFARGFATRRWHRIAAGFPGIAVFAALMFIATIVHWDKFNHGDAPTAGAVSFYSWVGVYAVSPFLVAWVWIRNRGADAGTPEPRDARVPSLIRALAAAGGAGLVLAGAVAFLSPETMMDHWPWTLTPLTARVMGACLVESGLIALVLARDARWSAWRILTQTTVVGAALLLIGVLRAWDDLDSGDPAAILLIVGLPVTIVGAAVLHVVMDRAAAVPPGC